jgi:hypothetical protein
MGKHWASGKKLGKQSEECKNKKKRFKEDNHFFGKNHTNESKEKMSRKLKGRSVWNRQFVPIKQIDPMTGNVVARFKDKKDAVKEGFDIRCINRCLKKPNLKHKGFYFLKDDKC